MGDPLRFCKAEEFFEASRSSGWKNPTTIVSASKYTPKDIQEKEHWHGVVLTFDDNTLCVVQFIRPTLWRLRYDPSVTDVNDYGDVNSRTIVMDYMSELVEALDTYLGLGWTTELKESDDKKSWIFTSEVKTSAPKLGRPKFYEPGVRVNLVLQKSPFRIQARRVLRPLKELYSSLSSSYQAATITPGGEIVWQTSERALLHHVNETHGMMKDVVLDIEKTSSGAFVGWGEQGGTSFVKQPCYMNYFNFDNMQYQQVYGGGPLDPREPLYHSDPFFLDLNSNPGHANVTACFLDNYSQIAVDFGKSNKNYIKLGTRFGTMDCYLITANTVPDIVWLYTSLIGRPRLKPRYVLGHHQACYGYDDDESIHAVWDQYRKSGIPLDGLHIDVDFQDKFKTFTIDPGFFGKRPEKKKYWPGPKDMFAELRANGIKCCTNITPIISLNDKSGGYPTFTEGYNKGWVYINKSFSILLGNLRLCGHSVVSMVNIPLYQHTAIFGLFPVEPTETTAPTEAELYFFDAWHFIMDERYTVEANNPDKIDYMFYGGGQPNSVNPNDVGRRPDYGDLYEFGPNWNSKIYPYHGAVSYGYKNGTAGFYPDLNRQVVRDWWGKQYKYLFDQGLEFVWQDMTTPAIHESYGDMKGLPSRLIVSSDGVSKAPDGSENFKEKKLAIEIWALFSYNLLKATSSGLDDLHKLVPSRQGKRNFILGRGSFAGMYRYAGLWTGDNASTWDFWKITVSQVLSAGLNGVSIAGADAGGFEPYGNETYCSPELLIRWYAGSFLLPWLRNHYVKKIKYTTNGQDVWTKWFQEPYAYPKHFSSSGLPETEKWLYEAVENICRYYVQLRYSLMQLLYDAMFENMIDGLPIARSMLLTDTQDASLFDTNQEFLDNQYVVRRDVLVAPIMKSKNDNPGENRDVYLPLGNFWYPFNLRPLGGQGVALDAATEGGKAINYNAPLTNDENRFAYVTPVYIREGGIIPQLKVTQWIGDGQNSIRFNIYPGKDRKYTTYLDDGVSRRSAPNEIVYRKKLSKQVFSEHKVSEDELKAAYLDPEAKGEYRAVTISQETLNGTRTITVTREFRDNDYNPVKELGGDYTIILWYDQGVDVEKYEITVKGSKYEPFRSRDMRTVGVYVKEIIGASEKIEFKVIPK